MPDGPGNVAVVYGVAGAAVLIGIVVAVWGHELKPADHHPLAVGGTIMLTVAIYSATSAVAAVSLAALYISVALDVCAFFRWRYAAVHVLFAVICCMVVMTLRPETPWWAGVVAAGATVGVGVVVGLLRRFAMRADVDALTGLPNLRGFERTLSQEVTVATRHGAGLSLVVLNLDRFHALNDQHGFRAGDEVLQQTARSWLALLGPNDSLARTGGDRFAVLLPRTTDSEATARADLLRVAVSMGCSAGVTAWQPGDSASFFVRRAEVALYRAELWAGTARCWNHRALRRWRSSWPKLSATAK